MTKTNYVSETLDALSIKYSLIICKLRDTTVVRLTTTDIELAHEQGKELDINAVY